MNEHELIGAAVIAWMSAKGIELAKNTKIIPLSQETEILNRWVARVVAFISAFGVHSSFDGSAGVFTITGLTFSGIGTVILEYARQYMMQEIAYKKFVKDGKTT